ncbi:MAG: D-alanyl-D-alanine carboxypeptidase family protein [Actinobacteria bacterium]|nr:D-alanyl-D-alanine carboxypeptidase family protein [Actinomycetota bacterium]
MPPVVTALLSGDPRAVSDLAYVQKSVNRVGASRNEIARDLDAQNAEAVRALEQSAAMRAAALASRQALDGQVADLAEKADRLTAELTDAASRLEQARAAEQEQARLAELARLRAADQERVAGQVREIQRQQAAAAAAAAEQQRAAAAALQQQSGGNFGGGAGGGAGAGALLGAGAGAFAGAGCQPASPYGEANGFLSPASLCLLASGGGHRLRTDAGRAFDALSRARQAATGAPLCVTDSYRSYPEQVDVFKRKPELAATPGRSQHGWGLAVDLCGGVQTFGSEAHVWMQLNAPRYGWIHPGWARAGGSRPEAWHWEYVG